MLCNTKFLLNLPTAGHWEASADAPKCYLEMPCSEATGSSATSAPQITCAHSFCCIQLTPMTCSLLKPACGLQSKKAFQQHRTPARVQQVRCISAQQKHETRKPAETALRNTLTAFLAAGAILLPHPSLAVSGGGGLGTPHNYEDLSHKDLKKNAYTKAELRQTNFSYSDLSGVSLFGALAKGANFEGATLRATDLESCDLEDADFTNAVLEGAAVTRAQLKNIKITGSDWTDVALRKDALTALCKIASGTNPTTGVDTKESLMCP